MRIHSTVTVIFALAFAAMAQTPLSGRVGNLTLDSTRNPYVVNENVIVERGKTLTIKAGCILLFKMFTGIEVQGSLLVQGTSQRPVIFTSFNDGRQNLRADSAPAPFDWNGILIKAAAERADLRNVIVCYAVFGIKAESEKIEIRSATFAQNGQYNMTVRDRIIDVRDNIPVTFPDVLWDKKAEQSAGSENGRRYVGPSVCAVVAVAAVVGTAYFAVDARNMSDAYSRANTQEDMDHYAKRVSGSSNVAVACGIAAGVLVPAATIWFTRAVRHTKASGVSLVPFIEWDSYGVLTSWSF